MLALTFSPDCRLQTKTKTIRTSAPPLAFGFADPQQVAVPLNSKALAFKLGYAIPRDMLTHNIIADGDAELCYNVQHCIWLYTDFCMLLYLIFCCVRDLFSALCSHVERSLTAGTRVPQGRLLTPAVLSLCDLRSKRVRQSCM